jgi:hypothetical protein
MKGLFPSLAAMSAMSFAVLSPSLLAQVVVSPGPQVGSPNTITADPPVPVPHQAPCGSVQLFTNQAFADFSPKPFNYAPPADCAGPWSKVVLSADFTVTAGRQFDRTAMFSIGNMNVYYGTTAEPRRTLSPSWHIERDLTDLSAGLKAPQAGQAILGNIVNSTFTGIIYANARIDFYRGQPEQRVADLVVPVPNQPGGAFLLANTSSVLTQSLNLPRNTEAVYLDVFAQSQIGDEFWWSCVPNDVAAELQGCGNTAFRETEITVDGQPAGVAPVYPWIYTGGVDPFLWAPIPAVQALNFKPYRVNLSPFAGVLADGNPHTVGIQVFNADNFFLATANLLVFTDQDAKSTAGGVLVNTLTAAPSPQVTENLSNNGGNITGTIATSSNRSYTISGWVGGSHGRTLSTVTGRVNFSNNQTFNVTATDSVQDIVQQTTVDTTSTTEGNGRTESDTRHFSFPLTFNIEFQSLADGSFAQVSSADQSFVLKEQSSRAGEPHFASSVSNQVTSQDTLTLSPSFSIIGGTNRSSTQLYQEKNTDGYCYGERLTSADGLLTGVQTDVGCNN